MSIAEILVIEDDDDLRNRCGFEPISPMGPTALTGRGEIVRWV